MALLPVQRQVVGQAVRLNMPTTDLEPRGERLTLKRNQIVSVSVDEVYRAMRNNPAAPDKDAFVASLTRRLQAKLKLQIA